MGFDLTGLGGVFDFASKVIDKIFPDPEKKAEAQLKLLELQQSGKLAELAAETDITKAQLAVNVEEAKSPNMFIAGGRPFCIWVGGFGLAYAAILEPVGRFIATVFYHYSGPFPIIDTTITMQVLFGLLGLGAYRSIEKVKGAEKNR